MKSYINLGARPEKRVSSNRRRSTTGDTMWIRHTYPLAPLTISWKPANITTEINTHIIKHKDLPQYVIGTSEAGDGDLLALVFSGPFKTLKAAKAAYMLEIG